MASELHMRYERMKAAGDEFLDEPKAMPWGTFVQFKDEDGHLFVIKEGKRRSGTYRTW